MQIYKIVKKNFYRNECVIYGSVQEALGTEYFDIFGNSGKHFNAEKLNALNIEVEPEIKPETNESKQLVSNDKTLKKFVINIYTKIIFLIKKIYNYL
jgi:hypothetical protein